MFISAVLYHRYHIIIGPLSFTYRWQSIKQTGTIFAFFCMLPLLHFWSLFFLSISIPASEDGIFQSMSSFPVFCTSFAICLVVCSHNTHTHKHQKSACSHRWRIEKETDSDVLSCRSSGFVWPSPLQNTNRYTQTPSYPHAIHTQSHPHLSSMHPLHQTKDKF